MKRSFHEDLLIDLGLDPETDAVYLDHDGHVQRADQLIAIEGDRPRLSHRRCV